MKNYRFEHPEMILLGNETVIMDICNTDMVAHIVLMNRPTGWLFGYATYPVKEGNVIPFKNCKKISIHDEIRNHGKLYTREFLVDADGMQLWGKGKIYKDRVKTKGVIEMYCHEKGITYEYTVLDESREIEDDRDSQ